MITAAAAKPPYHFVIYSCSNILYIPTATVDQESTDTIHKIGLRCHWKSVYSTIFIFTSLTSCAYASFVVSFCLDPSSFFTLSFVFCVACMLSPHATSPNDIVVTINMLINFLFILFSFQITHFVIFPI